MIDYVLDASALLALLQDEPGADRVAKALPDSIVGSVNLSEVVGKLVGKQMPEELVRDTLDGLDLDVHEFGRSLAFETGLLRAATVQYGLSLGDRACLALARYLKVPALTADQSWQRLNVEGVAIELIR